MSIKYINTYNELHLGDNVYHLDYLKKIINKYPEYRFAHYCNAQYHTQLQATLVGYEDTIRLYSTLNIPLNSINSWIGSGGWFYTWVSNKIDKLPILYDEMYIEWYNLLETTYGLPNPIKTSDDFLLHFNGLDVYDLEKTYDVLIINSVPMSGQYVYEYELFYKFCNTMSGNGMTLITTNKLENYECTLDYNYNICDIAKISTKCKYILAIHTGPLALCLNKYTINNVEFFHILDNTNAFSYDVCSWSKNLSSIKF